jgi:gliding motility-associated-like protein
MFRRTGWLILFILCFFFGKVWCQQDVGFHITSQLLAGKKILKVKLDFNDPYLWVLAANNGVYRVNSQTMAIDDYSSLFAGYSNFQFIDIVGYNQAIALIATNTTEILGYNNGTIYPIGPTQGLSDVVTSVGMPSYPQNNPNQLMISTAKGVGYYNTNNNSFGGYYQYREYTTGPVEIFADTYRTNTITDDAVYYPNSYPMRFYLPNTIYAGNIRHIAESNNQVYTAYYTPLLLNTVYWEGNLFWGNSTGLYQESLNFGGYVPANFNQYLTGININKIADIYGLDSFFNTNDYPFITKDDLLVGTDNGLYFSNSLLNNTATGTSVFSLFHYDELGNIRINDLCVDTKGNYYNGGIYYSGSYNTKCEDGVWIATDNGLYYLWADFATYLPAGIQTNAIVFKTNDGSNPSGINICSGGSITINLTTAINDNSIQWQKNGEDIVGQTGTTLNVTESVDYSAILFSPCNSVHLATNHLKVTTISGPTFTFNYPPVIQNCNANPVPLTVTGDPSYQYRWYTNGVLNGNTTQTLTATASGEYYVEVSACTNSWVPSSKVQVSLVNLPVPAITGDKTTYCQGDAATLSANVPVDQSYTINWYKNGTPLSTDQNFPNITTSDPGNYTVILTGTGSTCTQSSVVFPLNFTPPPTFTFNYPASLSYCAGSTQTLKVQGNPAYQYQWYSNGTAITGETTDQLSITQPGTYNVQVSACPGSWVPSSTVAINFIQTPVPSITTDKPSYCVGDNATLSVDAIPDPTITVNWYRDNVLLPEFSGDFSIMTNVSGTYTAAVVGNAVDANGNVCSSLSSPVVIGFNPAQVINIQQTANNGLCDGQTVTLKAIYTTGTIQWSTGETTDEINVTTSGTYTVTLTTPSGCTASSSQTVAFLPLPVLNVRDTAVCFYKQQTATLTAPPGFAQYTWNNQGSGPTYTATQPGTVTLTVTDANGCQATQKIQVADLCPEVEIPNTFTPNGDNVNDTWVIQGLDGTGSVKIFNRYGTLLYKNTGYYTPWDGTYNGKKVPAGVYYYIITTKSGAKKYSGSVTILY